MLLGNYVPYSIVSSWREPKGRRSFQLRLLHAPQLTKRFGFLSLDSATA